MAEVTGKIPDAKTMEEPSEIAQQAQEDVQAEHKTPPDSGQTITALLEAGSRFLSFGLKNR